MPFTDPFQEVLTDAAASAQRYLQSIHERHVGVPPEALDNLPKLGGPLSAQGQDPKSVLKLLDEIGSPATIANTGGRFFGGVIGGALPASVAAHWPRTYGIKMLVCLNSHRYRRTWKTWCSAGW
jgi:hypothetical protein